VKLLTPINYVQQGGFMANFRDFKAIKNELAAVVAEVANHADAIAVTAVRDNLREWHKKIVENRFRILFLGDFKRGKSTTINAFIGEKLLPSDMKPCTGGITAIRYDDQPHAEATFWDESKPAQAMTIEEFQKNVVIPPQLLLPAPGNDTPDNKVALDKMPYRELALYVPLPICRDGIEIIDSPGLDEDRRRTELTTSYVPKSDCAVFVLAANQLLSESERDNIKSFRLLGLQDIFFVVNFWDLVQDADDPEKEAQDLKERIRRLLPGEEHVFFVSARNALRGKLARDNKKVDDSGFRQFETAITQFLAKDRARIVLSRYQSLIERSVVSILEAIEQRRSLATQSITEVQQHFEIAQPKLALARQRLADIQRLFEDGAVTTTETARTQFLLFCDELKSRLQTESASWEASAGTAQHVIAGYQRQAQKFMRSEIESWSATKLRDVLITGLQAITAQADDLAVEVLKDMAAIRSGQQSQLSTAQLADETRQQLSQALLQETDTAAPAMLGNPDLQASAPWSKTRKNLTESASQVGGAVTGALIGSAIVPGIGTMVGYFVGYIAGSGLAGNLEDNAKRNAAQNVNLDAARAAVVQSTAAAIGRLRSTNTTELAGKVRSVLLGHLKHYEHVLAREISNTEGQITAILTAKKDKTLEVEPELKRLSAIQTALTENRAAAGRLIGAYQGVQ
jgi:GTPase SAR1 family protein